MSNFFKTINLNEFQITEDQKKFSNNLFINKMNFIKEEFEFVKNLPLDSKLKYSARPSNLGLVESEETKSKEILGDDKVSIDSEKDNLVDN